jgi:hypothetical protein
LFVCLFACLFVWFCKSACSLSHHCLLTPLVHYLSIACWHCLFTISPLLDNTATRYYRHPLSPSPAITIVCYHRLPDFRLALWCFGFSFHVFLSVFCL